MTESVEIREALPDDLSLILDVLRAALGEPQLLKRTPELFNWKHTSNPFGKSIVLVAEIDGRIAGVRALMRWDLVTANGDVLRCSRAVDTATHPDYARRGVFRALTLRALDAARNDGIDLVFNTPNEQSAPGYLKMGWSRVGWIGAKARPKLTKGWLSRNDGQWSLEQAVPEMLQVMPTRVEDRRPVGLRTPRTPAYVDWRFRSHPTARYAWVPAVGNEGLVVRASTRRGRRETLLVDMFGGRARPVRELTRASRSDYVATWFTPGSPEARTATRAGLLTVPGVKTLQLVVKPLRELNTNVWDLGSWDFALSDLELL